jgi:hypothetical protein
VHLVHPDAVEAFVLALEHVEQPDRLPVGQREDHVGARPDVREDVLGPARGGERSRHGRRIAQLAAARRHDSLCEDPCMGNYAIVNLLELDDDVAGPVES